jgi:menaquinone-specific isochorismate synthase
LLAAAGSDGFLWQHEGFGLAGRGVALRIELPRVLTDAATVAEVAATLAAIRPGDDVAGPGTGAVALGALQFVRDAPGSLVVPRVVIGRRDSEPWITTITRPGDRPVAGRFPRIPPGRRPSRWSGRWVVFTLDAGCQHVQILRTCRVRSLR